MTNQQLFDSKEIWHRKPAAVGRKSNSNQIEASNLTILHIQIARYAGNEYLNKKKLIIHAINGSCITVNESNIENHQILNENELVVVS